MIIKKRTVYAAALTFLAAIIAVHTVTSGLLAPTDAKPKYTQKIIIDAGHGGFDGGAVAKDGTVEKDINLNIATTLSQMLENSGYQVIMTRNSDTATDTIKDASISRRKTSDLKNRLKLMKDNPDAVFISIHLNKFTTSAANGSQIFYCSKTEGSKELADCVQKSIVEKLQPENKRVNKPATSGTYLLNNAPITAILVECGFLSNTAELIRLKEKNYQSEIAFSIYCGVMDYFSRDL